MYDTIIIGAGSAGLTGAIYAARSGMKTAVIEKTFAGGQITSTLKLENFPGFPDGISGIEFASRLNKQALQMGAELIEKEAVSFEKQENCYCVKTTDGVLFSKTLIFAMGAHPRRLNLEGEESLTGLGVSYCATCDGAFFKDKRVCVIGGGDTAFEDALYLSSLAKEVYLIHRRDSFRAQQVLISRAKEKQNISLLVNKAPKKLLGKAQLEGLVLTDTLTGAEETLLVNGCFVAIGQVPDTALLTGFLTLSKNGYIPSAEDTKTELPGVFAAGDIREKSLRQVITAASDGAVAATAAKEYLLSLKNA